MSAPEPTGIGARPLSQAARVPEELRVLPQWVCWRSEERRGKPTKVPCDPRTGTLASTTDPRTWCDFATALHILSLASQNAYNTRNCARSPGNSVYYMHSVTEVAYRYAGLGFVFSASDPLCGVDLDGAFRDDGRLYDWAAELLSVLDSYAEISPGGRGIHVIARAHVGSGRRCGAIEVYDRARYFTMTGDALGDYPSDPQPRQAQIDDLLSHLGPAHDEHIVPDVAWRPSGEAAGDLRARARAGRIRHVTLALLDSTGADVYGSPSEADAALCAGLAGVGLTAGEIYELVIAHPRGQDGYRRKGPRHGDYYWRRTIAHAVGFVGPVVDAGLRVQEVR